MNFIPLDLGIARPQPQKRAGNSAKKNKKKASGAHAQDASSNGKIPADLKQKIFERDEHTCRCCGFVSSKYQEIHFIDNNHKNFNEDNLATTCIFCHQCFNMENVAEMRSGVLIWLPEIEQARLNHIARAIYVARISQGPVAEAARKSLDAIMARREEVKKRISTDDPYILSTVLRDYMGPKHYHQRIKKLDGVRLFPLDRRIIKEADLEFNQFPQILAYWRSKDGPFGGKVPTQWISIYQDIVMAA